LTKQFEEYRIGTGGELAAHYAAHPAKGEIVFLVRAATKEERRGMEAEEEADGEEV
jgi:16S rRNA (cytidine1402-2'-O)-methyltransferase